ncbi:MAG: DUF169 domain-containing protein [Bacteroidales bacterium]|nr:DUF169 domain-containing protein [Bacteroidales bacterium]
MEVTFFINNYKEAFGEKAELPLVFWYSDTAIAKTEKINGCFFKGFESVRNGKTLSLSLETIGCGGGKFYTGFTDMPKHVPNFVSLKEKYKKTPEMVLEYIEQLKVPKAKKLYLNFARIDAIDNDRLNSLEGLLFLATPDVLSGLCTWAYFDNNSEETVVSLFGSGCSAIITRAVTENRQNGKRTFLGLFDPSVRPHIDKNVLSFVIPLSRFKEMYYTMRESCLFDTHAWNKVRKRINE